MDRRTFLISGIAVAGAAMVPLESLLAAPAITPLRLSDAQWRKRLTHDRYVVLRQAGTEAPYSSPLNDEHRAGVFACVGCHLEAFDSKTKFDSHTGWPSFYRARTGAVRESEDRSLPGSARTEVSCARCAGHLGHVFDDGPQPTGLRYCMNGLALEFHPASVSHVK